MAKQGFVILREGVVALFAAGRRPGRRVFRYSTRAAIRLAGSSAVEEDRPMTQRSLRRHSRGSSTQSLPIRGRSHLVRTATGRRSKTGWSRPLARARRLATATYPSSDKHWGSAAMFEHGRVRQREPAQAPYLGRQGNRRDLVEFHPAYHPFMAESIAAGLHASTWSADGSAPAARPTRGVRPSSIWLAQAESGHMCPITMTRAWVAALGGGARAAREVDAEIRHPHLRSGASRRWWRRPASRSAWA